MEAFEGVLDIVEVAAGATGVDVGGDFVWGQRGLSPRGLVGRIGIEVRYVREGFALQAAFFPVAPSVIVHVRGGLVEVEEIGAFDVQYDECGFAAGGPSLGLLLDRGQDEHGIGGLGCESETPEMLRWAPSGPMR